MCGLLAVGLLRKLATGAWVVTTAMQSRQPAQSVVAFAFGLDTATSSHESAARVT